LAYLSLLSFKIICLVVDFPSKIDSVNAAQQSPGQCIFIYT